MVKTPWQKLSDTHNIAIVMGDFNAHLGADDATYTSHSSTKSDEKLMIDYLQETNLMIGNTSFRKKERKIMDVYFRHERLKSQVDYTLINWKWKNSIKNCKAYSSFSSIGSDHQIVSIQVKISFRLKKETWPTTTRLERTSGPGHCWTIQHLHPQQILCITHRRYHWCIQRLRTFH